MSSTAACEQVASSPIDPERIAEAVQRLRVDGYAVLEDVVPLDAIAAWRAAFPPLLEDFARRVPANRGAHRWCMRLPFAAPFSDPVFTANPAALAVMRAILGDDIVCGLFTSDTPFPGAEHQGVHRDIAPLFPRLGVPLPPCALVVNIPLVDYTEDNGPMEVWPGGTHLAPDDVDAARAAPTMLSRRLRLTVGSLLLRDLRTWHRGTPNRSAEPRPNLTATYTHPWYRLDPVPVTIAASVFSTLRGEQQRIFRQARVVPDELEETLRERPLNG
jgi:ectoine hydroxylase-related dioxygenase (phytanoyl-CoA dioxygenase family)